MNLGKRIAKARKDANMQQADLCALVPGLTQQALSALERRDSSVSEYACQIADALKISLRWLLTGEGSQADAEWPFRHISRARWLECSPEDRAYIEGVASHALDEIALSRKRSARA